MKNFSKFCEGLGLVYDEDKKMDEKAVIAWYLCNFMDTNIDGDPTDLQFLGNVLLAADRFTQWQQKDGMDYLRERYNEVAGHPFSVNNVIDISNFVDVLRSAGLSATDCDAIENVLSRQAELRVRCQQLTS